MKERPKNLWKYIDTKKYKYQYHATIPTTNLTNELNDDDEKIVYMYDLEKRKQVYGICGECNEPGTGRRWYQPCNAKRNCLEWIPYENFQNITYMAEGGFSKIYSAERLEGHIKYWNIEDQK
ncbi:uncharacterized protein OCT59_014852 [Rhizophagus irregularis]|uniref:uncharacterized protein n=1 Tax=Rhizophagus irregularis TaxID=588596 RepID=UPI0033271D38|nr:hypothetical protein OCT59_014852 [Rhizophagus irregularis]